VPPSDTRREFRARPCAALACCLLAACATDPKPDSRSDRLRRDYPVEIIVHAEARGCRLDDNYIAARPSGTDPPFAYLYARGERVASAFWCARTTDGRQMNLLLVVPYTNTARARLNCPGEIEAGDSMGGLVFGGASFLKTLDEFTALSVPAKRAPPGTELPETHLVNTRQGEVTIYACHAGEWWYYRFK